MDARTDKLIEPEALAAHLDRGDTPAPQLIDLSREITHQTVRIPGARRLDPTWLVGGEPPAVGRLPGPDRLALLQAMLGLDHDPWIVLLDDEGGGWAGRLAWTLEVMGHSHWSYLNGGIHAWRAAGLPTESGAGTELVPPAEPAEPRSPRLLQRALRATLTDVLAAIDDPDTVIWDARSPEEYRGERSGSRRAGHVPGAINLDWLVLIDRARGYRIVEDAAALLASHGIRPDRRVITHCQSHHRSGLTWMVGHLLGYPDMRAYDGSWGEWGNRPETPIESD